jgi:hypothetical protein
MKRRSLMRLATRRTRARTRGLKPPPGGNLWPEEFGKRLEAHEMRVE